MEKNNNSKTSDKMMSYFVEKKLINGFKDIFLEEARQDEKYQRKLYTLSGDTQFDEESMKQIIASDTELLSPHVKEKIMERFKSHLSQHIKT